MTPPSTSQIAPVTQLAAGESRNVMVLRDHAARHRLGDEEDGPVQFEVRVVVGALVGEDGL